MFPVTTRTHNLLVKDRDRDLFAYERTLNIEYRHTGKTRPGHRQAYNNKLAAIETLNTLQPSGSQEVRSPGTQQKKPSDLRSGLARFQGTVLGGSISCLVALMVLDFGRVINLT